MVLIKILSDADNSRTFAVPLETSIADVKKLAMEQSLKKENIEYDVPSAQDIDNLLGSLQATFSDHAHRSMIIKIANNPETLQNLIDCIPGLRQDPIAQAVLKDSYLLIHWINAESAANNFADHPCLFAACQQLIGHMHADLLRNNGLPPLIYETNLEQYSTDEEEDENEPAAAQALSARTPRLQITTQYLAAALAAATSNQAASSSTANSSTMSTPAAPPSTPRQQPQPGISTAAPQHATLTTEMLRQAMQQAFAAVSQSAVPGTSTQMDVDEENYLAQMSELISMGFLDRDENLRALRHAKGGVQGALDYIINEREKNERSMGLD